MESPVNSVPQKSFSIRRRFRSLLALLSAFAFLATSSTAQTNRTWTSPDGRSLEAALLASDGKSALLRAADTGHVYRIALANLVPADQEWVRRAQRPPLPDFDLAKIPTEQTLARLAVGEPEDFALNAAVLRHELLAAYGAQHSEALETWLGIYRWLDLFQERPFHQREGEGRVGADWPPSLRAFVLRNFAFTRTFFATLSPADDVGAAGEILNRLYRNDPELFHKYLSLALAIAVVYDVRSPGIWWASGVAEEIQPPGRSDAVEVFNFFAKSAEAGRLAMDPRRLTPRELRFAVNVVASFEDLRWAQQNVRLSTGRFANAYSMIAYDYTRYSPGLRELNLKWPHADYRLPTIRRVGGICTDQAYFASQVGKARGLPTARFNGSGENGGHAWIGYLEGPGKKWNLEVGRYEANNYVVGHTLDPQTGAQISDHELRFLNEDFHRSTTFRISAYHLDFAREFWISDDASSALRAAQRAINIEPRNRVAWDLVLEINLASHRIAAFEAGHRLAAEAFRHYPHVQADYLGRLGERVALRGDFDQAFDILEEVSRRNRGQQADISVACLRRILEIARDSDDPQLLVKSYRRTLSSLAGHTPAGLFIHSLAMPFLTALHRRGEETQARILVARTRQHLRPNPGTLADRELELLEQSLR